MRDIKNSSIDYSAGSSRLGADNDVVVGFDGDLLAIKEQLCGESRSLQVIPIVGMGGIGKTTLARNAYHDPLIREYFDIGGWVTVSQSFSIEEIISRLQQSLKNFDAKGHESAADVTEMKRADAAEEGDKSLETIMISAVKALAQKEPPAVQVHKALKGRRYLIVMDDIWSTKVCDDLKKLFPDDGNGSRIMLTTRILDVATYANDCGSPHEMKLMDEDHSWDLLRQKVFAEGVCNHKELEDIGMAIARDCRGLPLAIVVIAGLLSTVDRSPASWEEIKEKVNSTVAARDGQLEKILTWSYMDLPRHLRQCFVYIGGFPEDHEIPVAKLIKLWAAEGFVGAGSASRSLEEEAEEYLHDLIKRSLVLVGKRNARGEIKICRLHDLMRDFCKRKAHEDKFPLYDVHAHNNLIKIFQGSSTLEDVRAIDWDPSGKGDMFTVNEIFRISSLRYLVLDCYFELPAAVSNLENLQTLIIYANKGLVCLPREIWRMQQLRHLVSSFDQLPCPVGVHVTCFPQENLQTLSELVNLECSYEFVKMVPNIKKLGLVYSGSHDLQQRHHLGEHFSRHQLQYHQAHYYETRLENLKWLHQLEKLRVRVYPGFQGRFNPIFPPSLKRLSLSGWRLTSWSDMTIVGSLPNLQVLKLTDFGAQDEKWETAEGEFAHLAFLLITRSDLQDWITEIEHFPSLKWLRIHQCWQLHKIPTDIGEIPTLELIEVKDCGKALYMWARQILEEQQDLGNDSLEVRCRPDRYWRNNKTWAMTALKFVAYRIACSLKSNPVQEYILLLVSSYRLCSLVSSLL